MVKKSLSGGQNSANQQGGKNEYNYYFGCFLLPLHKNTLLKIIDEKYF